MTLVHIKELGKQIVGEGLEDPFSAFWGGRCLWTCLPPASWHCPSLKNSKCLNCFKLSLCPLVSFFPWFLRLVDSEFNLSSEWQEDKKGADGTIKGGMETITNLTKVIYWVSIKCLSSFSCFFFLWGSQLILCRTLENRCFIIPIV